MAWIESHQEIGRHPKTKKLARVLGISIPTAMGHLHLLWHWATDFAQDGDLSGFEAWELADAALWEGEPEAFVTALTDAGFVDRTDTACRLHDWDEYAGKLIDRRKQDAERKRRSRHKADQAVDVPDDSTDGRETSVPVPTPSTGRPTEVTRMSVVTVPNSTEPTVSSTPSQKRAAKPPAATGRASPKATLPGNGPAQLLVKAFCEATGLERPAAYAKAVGQAQKLVDAGCTPADMPNIVSWLWSQSRFRGEIDLGVVLGEFDKWRVSRLSPGDDRYITAFGDDNIDRMAGWLDELNDTFGGSGWVRTSLRRLAVEVPGLSPDQVKAGLTIGYGRAESSLRARDNPIANPPALVHALFRQALAEQREVPR